jgi:hypothetical protein
MLSARLYLRLAVALACGVVGASAAQPVPCPIPLEKGMQWTYAGKVEWTMDNSAVVCSTNVQWVMDVVDVVERGSVRASVVRGIPDELAWYEPGRTPSCSVLLQVTNRVYRIGAGNEQEGVKLARELTDERHPLPASAEEWLVLPLARGQRWAVEAADREDNWYCWYVQKQETKRVKADGYRARHRAALWTLINFTCPAHQVVEIAEGVGITRCVFVHLGTVFSANVRLVSFKNRVRVVPVIPRVLH